MSSYVELKAQLNSLKDKRKQFLHIKNETINNAIISLNQKDKEKDISEDLKEIDQQLEALESVITTSVNIAMSIITPVQEKERIITNITKTVEVLEIEKEIKNLLAKIDGENVIEAKIKIILQANCLIKTNPGILETYHDLFMKKSLDVLSHLNTQYNSIQIKITSSSETKEINGFINEMDKTSVLHYKLSNSTEQLFKFFTFLAENIKQLACPPETIRELQENIVIIKQSPSKDQIRIILQKVKALLKVFFYRISKSINQRLSSYLQIEGDAIMYLFIQHITKINGSILTTLLSIVLELASIAIAGNTELNDILCIESSSVLSSCEKFKFYLSTLCEKLLKYYTIPNQSSDLVTFFHNFNSKLYDIGEKYCNNEICYMKSKITSFFIEESRNYQSMLESHINDSYEELISVILTSIEDTFFILKMSGIRAINTLNVQIALAIINHIKDILSEDLFSLLDNKLSAILIKTESTRLKSDNSIKYICKKDPTFSYKNLYSNLFLISCLNSIDQSKINIPMLMDDIKNCFNAEIIDSPIFNHTLIKLNVPIDREKDLNSNMIYFKSNELEIIKITFADIDGIIKKYEDFLNRKMALSFEFLYENINSLIDMLNSMNYLIDKSNIATAEMSESFSGKLIDETEKILRQWRNQMSENVFSKFLEVYTEYMAEYLEKVLKRKTYSRFGVVLLQKDINKIANYYQGIVSIPIRDRFNKLFSFVKVLNFESKEEMKEYLDNGGDDIEFKSSEIEEIRKLKKD